eukprot:599867-Prymnesium_polylepis.1
MLRSDERNGRREGVHPVTARPLPASITRRKCGIARTVRSEGRGDAGRGLRADAEFGRPRQRHHTAGRAARA